MVNEYAFSNCKEDYEIEQQSSLNGCFHLPAWTAGPLLDPKSPTLQDCRTPVGKPDDADCPPQGSGPTRPWQKQRVLLPRPQVLGRAGDSAEE